MEKKDFNEKCHIPRWKIQYPPSEVGLASLHINIFCEQVSGLNL